MRKIIEFVRPGHYDTLLFTSTLAAICIAFAPWLFAGAPYEFRLWYLGPALSGAWMTLCAFWLLFGAGSVTHRFVAASGWAIPIDLVAACNVYWVTEKLPVYVFFAESDSTLTTYLILTVAYRLTVFSIVAVSAVGLRSLVPFQFSRRNEATESNTKLWEIMALTAVSSTILWLS